MLFAFLTALSLFAASAHAGKRGLVWPWYNSHLNPGVFNANGEVVAIYDYETYAPPSTNGNGGLGFIGMQRCMDCSSSPIADLHNRWQQQKWSTVFSLNEPDINGISPSQAASWYQRYINPLPIKKAFPAVTSSTESGKGLSWLSEFLKACGGKCYGDYVNVHWYGKSLEEFQSFIKQAHNQFPKYDIVVSEFALANPSGGTNAQYTFFQRAFPWLDSQSYVHLYFPFVATTASLLQSNDPGAVSFVGTGSCLFNDAGNGPSHVGSLMFSPSPKIGTDSNFVLFANTFTNVLASIQVPLLGWKPDALAGRRITVTNKCPYTVWPAMYTDPNNNKVIPSQPTGWEAPSGHSVSFNVPDDWASGRIWGRTQCDFRKPGAIACATGSCNGGLQCDKRTGTGVPPVGLAEFTLGRGNQPDNYDVSFVDGFNIPIALIPTQGCHAVECKNNLNNNCPSPLQLKSGNNVVGCKSACVANLDGHPANSANCCSGSHNTPQTCPASGVQYYSHFKNGCHDAYAYAYDDKTSLFTCPSNKKADYTVIFCP